jgi:uncharacterized protein (DUF427 family)
MWRWRGQERPPFAIAPGPGQESVWDYPRPPRVEPDARPVVVRAGDVVVASTRRALRVLETASPPTFYVPLADVEPNRLVPAAGASWCEWKGRARYWSLGGGPAVAWSYEEPNPRYDVLRDHVAFYPARVACFVGGVRVEPQPGGFYGGWVTPEIVGPWKGDPGTEGW